MKLDQYTLIARIFPALICAIPIVVLNHYYLSLTIAGMLMEITRINWIDAVTIPTVFTILFAYINRTISKELFERKIFDSDLSLPTTSFLLFGNSEYSTMYKQQIRTKILKDFKIVLPTTKEERINELGARKIISETVGRIRRFVGKGDLLLQHNMEYGFIRNIIGGSVIAVLLSITNIVVFSIIYSEPTARAISVITTILYSIPILLNKKLLLRYGRLYANILFQEYLNKR